MDIEDKLPKAEDVYRDSWNLLASGEIEQPAIIHAMHEYARRLLDVVAEKATTKTVEDGFYGMDVVDKKSILRFKELLK